jgi:hypothetical protein
MLKKSMILLGMLVVATNLYRAQAQTNQKPQVDYHQADQPNIRERDVYGVLRSLPRR